MEKIASFIKTLAGSTEQLNDNYDPPPDLLLLTKIEPIPEKEIFSVAVEDGTIFHYKYYTPQRLYVKFNGKEVDAAFYPDKGVTPILANGNAIFFTVEKFSKMFKAVFAPPDLVIVSFVRDRIQGESLERSGTINRVIDGNTYVYAMGDDPEKDAIPTNVPETELENLTLEIIHKDKIIYFSFDHDITHPIVRRLSETALVIEVASPRTHVSLSGFYRKHPTYPFFFIDKTSKILYALNTDTLQFLPPLQYEGFRLVSIVSIYNGAMIVDAVEEETEEYFLMTAHLPEGYIDKPSPLDLITPKVCDSRKFESEFLTKFKPTKLLGVGGFGCVFEALNLIDNCTYAVKRIALQGGDSSVDETLAEVRTLASLRHEGIIGYNSSWVEKPPSGWQKRIDREVLEKLDNPNRQTIPPYPKDSVFIYIQMELCTGSLTDWLAANSTRDLDQAKNWLKQIVAAVGYLHRKKKIHRDLKPSNILFDGEGRLKICDLGLVADCAMRDGIEVAANRSGSGTRLYMPPEQRSGNFTSSVDIYPLGLILAELLVHMPSYKKRQQTFNDFSEGKPCLALGRMSSVSLFIALLTHSDPAKRPTCEEILTHPFLA